MQFGSAVFDNEEQARQDMRRDLGLDSEDDSELESDKGVQEEEDHFFLFDADVPSERICASHARRDYSGILKT